MEKHLILSDFQIPDHNTQAVSLVLKVIKVYKPSEIHILGDFVNFTSVSKYDPDPNYDVGLMDEVVEGNWILRKIANAGRSVNKAVKIKWYEGNHEERLTRFLGRQAKELAKLNVNGEKVLSIPHLFQLKSLGIEWLDYGETRIHKDVVFHHGYLSRSKSGYTSHAMIEKTGMSGIQGHTHKFALVTRRHLNGVKFWVESGSLCNPQPTPRYAHNPDFVLGFSTVNIQDGKVYPQIYPIVNGTVLFEGRLLK